jgi:hypothetical protein
VIVVTWFLVGIAAGGDHTSSNGPASHTVAAPTDAPDDLLLAAVHTASRPLPERMAAISGALLGRPYVADPMGEGVSPDADPFSRYDAFDCLTYVEEVMSWVWSADPAGAAAIRDRLRYGAGPRDYTHRRHFMELQWIPGVIADGWFRDTTKEYGATVALEKQVTAATWSNWGAKTRFPGLKASDLPVGTMHLDVIPLAEAKRIADTIRPGSVVLTVHTDRPAVPLWTFHVSLLVPGPDGTSTLRHSTKIGDGGTVDHGVKWYLDHIDTYDRWEVLGIAVLEPMER